MSQKQKSCRAAISSMSLGRAYAGHDLMFKLEEAANAGFEGIEIFYEDLEYDAKKLVLGRSATMDDNVVPTTQDLLAASTSIREKCDELSLTIVGLQPFIFYEGLKDAEEHAKAIDKLEVWFQIVKRLGTDVIQIPTQFRQDDGVTGDRAVIVKDLLEVAEMGLQENPPVKFAYENLAWGRFVDTWESAWEIVKKVDRWNFGMCLDSFNIAGRVWADPGRQGGKIEGDPDRALKESLKAMVNSVDIKKVWYIQIVGAELLSKPLVQGHEWYAADQPSRMSWSRNARLFYGEEDRGQYLPIQQVSRAFLDAVDQGGMGYQGWVSMELFSRTMNDQGKEVPREHAKRGGLAWVKLVENLQLS